MYYYLKIIINLFLEIILLGYIINDRMRIFYCLIKDFILKSLIYMYIVYVSILWKRN